MKKYSPLGFPQVFYLLIPVLFFVGFGISYFKNPVSVSAFFENYPSFYCFVSSNLKTFQNCLYISSIILIFITHEFYGFSKAAFAQLNKNENAIQTKILRYCSVLFAYITVIGILGVLIFPISDSEYFQDIMQKIFFFHLFSYLIVYDLIIKKLNDSLPLSIFIYDSFMSLLMIAYFFLHLVPLFNQNNPNIPSSLIEYSGLFLCILKFPICGWELSLIKLKDAKKTE